MAEQAVYTSVNVPLSQNQFDALVSFTFNVGTGAFRTSTFLQKLNIGQYDAVRGEMNRFINAGGRPHQGLVNRRKDEGNFVQRWNIIAAFSADFEHEGRRLRVSISYQKILHDQGSYL